MYDPILVVAVFRSMRRSFFDPVHHIGPKNALHLIIGANADRHGLIEANAEKLHNYMMTRWLRSAGRPISEKDGFHHRPVLLHGEQLTAALTPMKDHSDDELEVLKRNVRLMLENHWTRLGKYSSTLDTWRERDRLMAKTGPRMMLVDWKTIQKLGRIPHSAERRAITMEEACNKAEQDKSRFFIEMFSHRWCSPYAPDDRYNSKARVLVEWGKYRQSMGFRTFYWIDYACIDQSDIYIGVAMLPLYVSCCNNIVCYDTKAYEPRAWCRIERLLFIAFVAPNSEYVSPDFEYNTKAETQGPSGELKPTSETRQMVPDPTADDALISYGADIEVIQSLKSICRHHWGKCWKDGLMETVQRDGLKHMRDLTFGATQVRLRKYN
jgi:hypothetical protein